MPIVAGDIVWRYTGGAANTNPNASLGGVMSTVAGGTIDDSVVNDLWDNVSGAESAAGDVEYRSYYIQNNHGSLQWQSPMFWISSLTSSPDTEFDVGLDAAAVGTETTNSTSADEGTAPSPAVTFSRPTSKATGLALGSMNAGQEKAVWQRRTVTAGAAAASDSGAVRAEGDTNA